jgi:hypothetical protein
MDRVNVAAGGLRGLRGIVLAVEWLFDHPAIGIPVGILLICALIFIVVLMVRKRPGN